MMGIALQMDPHYSDAMAYLNLLYRLKASVADSAAESADAVSKANEWIGKALDAKRISPDSSPRGVTSGASPPPPPPPPPPPHISDTALATDAPMPAHLSRERRKGDFWQVVGAADMPAKELIAQLKAAGFPAGSAMTSGDSAVRVMVGPYPDDATMTIALSELQAAGYRVLLDPLIASQNQPHEVPERPKAAAASSMPCGFLR